MLASHLHMSLQRVQEETTATEFRIWMQFLSEQKEREVTELTMADIHTALITSEIRRSWVKKPNNVLLKDFLFGKGEPKVEPVKKSMQQKIADAKQYVFSRLGNPEKGN